MCIISILWTCILLFSSGTMAVDTFNSGMTFYYGDLQANPYGTYCDPYQNWKPTSCHHNGGTGHGKSCPLPHIYKNSSTKSQLLTGWFCHRNCSLPTKLCPLIMSPARLPTNLALHRVYLGKLFFNPIRYDSVWQSETRDGPAQNYHWVHLRIFVNSLGWDLLGTLFGSVQSEQFSLVLWKVV